MCKMTVGLRSLIPSDATKFATFALTFSLALFDEYVCALKGHYHG